MIDAFQIRAARALLNWSQQDLSRATGLAASSIKNIENRANISRKASLGVIRDALDDAGIEFLPASGVRFRSDLISVYTGRQATHALYDMIYHAAHAAPRREVSIFGADEAHEATLDGVKAVHENLARLRAAGITQRVLLAEGDYRFAGDPSAYRWLPAAYFSKSAPVYIAGDQIAIYTGTLARRTIIIGIKSVTHHMQKLFDFVWDRADPVVDTAAPAALARSARTAA